MPLESPALLTLLLENLMIAEVDIEKMKKLLTKSERQYHQRGWDQPPFLAVVELRQNPARLALPRLGDAPNPPVEFLMFVANEMIKSGGAEFLGPNAAVTQTSTFYGMAFCSEGWMIKRHKDDLREVAPSEAADRVEVRILSVVDLYGRAFQVRRTRGEAARVESVEDELVSQIGGNVYLALYSMVKSIVLQMPDNEAYLESLHEAVNHLLEV